jgi:hypothetical protein
MMLSPASVLYLSGEQINEDMSHFTLRSVSDLTHPSLIQTLKNKGINISLAKKYLKEVLIKDVSKNMFLLLGLRMLEMVTNSGTILLQGLSVQKIYLLFEAEIFLPNHIHVLKDISISFPLFSGRPWHSFRRCYYSQLYFQLPQIYPYVINYGYEKALFLAWE